MIAFAVLAALLGCAYADEPDDGNCGVPRITPIIGNSKLEEGRIVGGREVIPYSWPWMTQVRNSGSHYCGASLISKDWIVSAAHCFRGVSASSFSFRFGRHTTSGTNEPYEQSSGARTVIIHESYNSATTNNDIAVIRLSTPVTYTTQVSPVCLPSTESELSGGVNVHVTGWGNTQGTCCPTVLKQVMVPIVNRTQCNQPDYYNNRITTAMICAGLVQGGLDSCQGDSGGPLVAPINNKWELFGITSWGSGCAQPKKPGVYTNVHIFNEWIRSKVTQVEREEQEAEAKFRPAPFGAAFRELARQMVQKGEVEKSELPLNGEWMD